MQTLVKLNFSIALDLSSIYLSENGVSKYFGSFRRNLEEIIKKDWTKPKPLMFNESSKDRISTSFLFYKQQFYKQRQSEIGKKLSKCQETL